MNLFRFIPGYDAHIYDNGKEPLLFLFLAFIVAFALTRLYTRLARSRGWGSGNVGGVHLHHVVPGVILMVVCGILGFSTLTNGEVAYELVAIGFGVGAALTLDEFAMILHLRDVYWAEQGRTSMSALFMGIAFAGLLLVVSSPFGIDDETKQNGALTVFLVLFFNLSLAIVAFLKKKTILGMVGVVIPFFAVFPAVRYGKPGSPWARWFYDPAKAKTPSARARREFKTHCSTWRFTMGWPGRFERWFSDFVGGTPTLPEADAEHGRAG